MKIKICGITNLDDALKAEQLGADAIGFIFFGASKRYISPEIAREISRSLKPFTTKVGVFVNEDVKAVNKIAEYAGIDILQLHGNEDPAYAAKLVRPFIKSIRVKDKSDLDIMSQFVNTTFLLDSFNANLFGGTGEKFDWGLIPQRKRNNIILAGGVSRYNVGEIIEEIKPYAVDVSSSIEIEPGKKDHKKMEELFRVFREAGG
ncbi:MAG: N-(5'-phosphoribosyl)anthranilate isomerase [Melioribacteraceae bacterium]|nr:MAG: N-(5'-phosphoribosyl)anthranilate isomerase [Melioribacteraceae bacterium]